MSFLSRIGFVETEEQERTRLAQASEGSLNHYLSTLPVTGLVPDEWTPVRFVMRQMSGELTAVRRRSVP
ncbi:hypothetical protein ACGFYH_35740, partial [Streptomyces sp. NPDC048392]